MTALQFWFELASTYSYPAAMRIEARAQAAGVELQWRPFLLGPIFAAQGWNDSPFNIYAAKGRYMWRDLERVCLRDDLPFRRPSVFPRSGLLGARIASIVDERRRPELVRRLYTANFAEDRDIADATVVAEILASLDLPAAELLASAQSPAAKQALRTQTDEAIRLGIFGAPSFTVGTELFWGNDRLDDALAWATR